MTWSKKNIIMIILFFENFHTTSVFHWSLSDIKSSQVSRTFLTISTDLNNTAVWLVPNRPPGSNSCRLLSKPLGTAPGASITNSITVILWFHSFLSWLSRSKYLFAFLLNLIFTMWSTESAKSSNHKVLFFVDWSNEQSVHQWSVRLEFNPRLSHIKDLKNGTWCHLAKHSALQGKDQG